MERVIRDEIRRFVLESPDNRFPDIDRPYFEEPLIGFAAADDPLFRRVQERDRPVPCDPCGDHGELLRRRDQGGNDRNLLDPANFQGDPRKQSQGKADTFARMGLDPRHGEHFNTLLRMHLVETLCFVGARAVAPLLSGMWRPVMDPKVGMASTWSERHAAYVAGLGTFSLNDGFITGKGIAHRCGSVITDVSITPTGGPAATRGATASFSATEAAAFALAAARSARFHAGGTTRSAARHMLTGS